MNRKDKRKDKQMKRINRIFRTLSKDYPSYILRKICPNCLTQNFKEFYFCKNCDFDIHKVNPIRIRGDV